MRSFRGHFITCCWRYSLLLPLQSPRHTLEEEEEVFDGTEVDGFLLLLFKIDIVEGNLVCMETQRKFPITNGIPNMLLNEDEV